MSRRQRTGESLAGMYAGGWQRNGLADCDDFVRLYALATAVSWWRYLLGFGLQRCHQWRRHGLHSNAMHARWWSCV